MNVRSLLAVSALCLSTTACEGPIGPAGPVGPVGQPGSGLKQQFICEGFADLVGDGRGFSLQHNIYRFHDGSVMTTCETIGGMDQSSSTRFYKAGQNGTAPGGCYLTFDADTSSSGYWDFRLTEEESVSLATYRDTASTLNGRVFRMPCKVY